jgi:hypothetical protein
MFSFSVGVEGDALWNYSYEDPSYMFCDIAWAILTDNLDVGSQTSSVGRGAPAAGFIPGIVDPLACG